MKTFLAIVALLAATFAAYAPVAHNDFVVYDDNKYLTDNPVVQEGLTLEGLRWSFTNRQTANFHPLTWLAHMTDVELFGMRPGAHHLVSVALHALTATLVLLAFLRYGWTRGPALLLALLFALHPLRVESVAWAAERKDVLSGLFFALCLYLHAARPRGHAILLALALLAGLAAKSMLVTVPFLLLLLDLWPQASREPLVRRIVPKLPLVVLVTLFSFVALRTQGDLGALRTTEALGLQARLANASAGVATYVQKSLWPTDLAVFYPHPAIVTPEADPWTARAWIGLTLVVGVSALALGARRRLPALFVGWFWFLGMLVPVIGIVQVGEQAWADRYAYLPTLGLTVGAVALAWQWASGETARRAVLLSGLVLAGLCAGATHAQTKRWRDTRTLFEHARAVTEHNYVAEIGLALLAERANELTEAEAHYRAALAAHPRAARAHNNLGVLLDRKGRAQEARTHLDAALAIEPRAPETWNNLGIWHARQGAAQAALEAFSRAVEERPDYGEAHRNRGGLLEQLGRLDEAAVAYERAMQTLGEEPRLCTDRARLEDARGRTREAVRWYARALETSSGATFPVQAALGYAWILATDPDPELRDGEAAQRVAAQAVRATRERSAEALRVLAAACAEIGEHEEAQRLQQRAIELAPEAPAGWRQERDAYRAGRPWRRSGS